MDIAGPTPHEDGFRMPARFSRHERTYMAWPTVAGYRRDVDRSRREYAAIATAISEFEPVTLVVHPNDASGAAGYLGGAPNVEVLELPINDAWIRDSGPIFVSNEDGEVALVNLQFNGWGGRLACDLDMRVGRHLGERLGMRIYDAPFICEGGGISVDGEGTLITTDRVMQNANRYTGMSREAVERLLLAYLGIEKVIWLERGLVEDESTDGHVDNNVEYIAPGVVLVQTVRDPDNPNYGLCRDHVRQLKQARDAKGRRLEIVEIDVLPYTPEANGLRMPVPYANYYVVNGALIVPALGGPEDAAAMPILQGLYPDRTVVPVDSTAIAWDGGGVGCITQQQPAGRPAR